jgi:hypothetical protein
VQGRSDYRLHHAVSGIWSFQEELAGDPGKTRNLLRWGETVRATPGVGHQVAERKFLDCLSLVAETCLERLEEAGLTRVAGFPTGDAVPPGLEPSFLVLQALHEFGMGCFRPSRARDSLAGHRRAAAFDLIGRIGSVVDLPEAVELARAALRKAASPEARQAAAFVETYFAARDEPPDDDLIERLLVLAERATSRSTVFQALNALIETGVIGELEALSRMDEWKDKHR